MVKQLIYMDYQATTPMDPQVKAAMNPFFGKTFGNPHSVAHRFGWEAEAAIDVAREHIAGLLGAGRPESIIFTSGATESNNLAIKGVLMAAPEDRRRVITVATEHKCVLESAAFMQRMGADAVYLPVNKDGLLDMERLEAELKARPAVLVSVMAVNNEIGVVQDLKTIGRLAKKHGALFHTDAAQAFGKIPLDADDIQADLISLSGHKIYGPKGVGVLYVRPGTERRIVPQVSGGGQERKLRSGTLAPALCVGFGKAAEIAASVMEAEYDTTARQARCFLDGLMAELPGLQVNGSLKHRYPGNLNVSFPGLDGDLLIANLRDLAVSSGAACASAEEGPSYVLAAIGVPEALARSSIRFGIGRFTAGEEIDYAVKTVTGAVKKMGGLRIPAEAGA